jgi:hypothetical protein
MSRARFSLLKRPSGRTIVSGRAGYEIRVRMDHITAQQTHADAAFDRDRPLIDYLDDIFRELDFN